LLEPGILSECVRCGALNKKNKKDKDFHGAKVKENITGLAVVHPLQLR
jgi:hypothetical protein